MYGNQMADKENHNTLRRKTVITSSYLLTLFLSLVVVMLVCLPFARRLTNNPDKSGMIIMLVVVFIAYIVAVTVFRLVWTVFMSFYLPIDEFRVIADLTKASKKIPVLTPLYQGLSNKILQWKIYREQ